ncbi:hypothetical protein SLEP1_g50654 [Rubroshorea leprosula]|uniref:JmjC domain-containing protein n=1 Tax=Rubroshorea leprosula TaxID=152421 RepID=A0AAV5M0Q5_9ROSI|nr:hypothetical protein SLEP1_g50654 [Rubroshorea leprosula]
MHSYAKSYCPIQNGVQGICFLYSFSILKFHSCIFWFFHFRLVQNVGEFVVTFLRAYHAGFSHMSCLHFLYTFYLLLEF